MKYRTGGRVWILFLAWTVLSSITFGQSSDRQPNERQSVLTALKLSFGETLEANPDYVILPTFSEDGLLVSITIKPKARSNTSDTPPLPRSEFDLLLAKIDSIKALGQHQEDMNAVFVHGGRAWSMVRYQFAYLRTGEPITNPSPRPVQFANIYYLHPVTGVPRVPKDSIPKDAGSFGLICIGPESYIAPKAEFLRAWSRPTQQQLFSLAGPTEDRAACTN